MYKRPRHQVIAQILHGLDSRLLRDHKCYFGGGTAIAMSFGEFRTSDDIDFLVSDLSSYRELRSLTKQDGLAILFNQESRDLFSFSTPRIDQYGIRGSIGFLDQRIKFEIIHEGRIHLNLPSSFDQVEGISRLDGVDLVAEKLLANSDRWADTAVKSRDILDLSFLGIRQLENHEGFIKASKSYGESVKKDLEKAVSALIQNPSYLEMCLTSLEIDEPAIAVVTRLKNLL